MTLRSLTRATIQAALLWILRPTETIPKAVKGAIYAAGAGILFLVAGTFSFAQTPRTDIQDAIKTDGLLGALYWFIGILCISNATTYWRATKVESETRKELLSISERMVNSLNTLSNTVHSLDVKIEQHTSKVNGMHEIILRNNARTN